MRENRLEKYLASEQIERLSLEALQMTYARYIALGEKGTDEVQKNQFGEIALKMDVEAERVIIDTFDEAQLAIRIISEEHGVVDLSDNPLYLGILDGLDGSNEYKKDRLHGRCGTMFGIFLGTDPVYDDYLFGGVMEHSTGRLFFASRGKGAWVFENGRRIPIKCSDARSFNRQTRIYIDDAGTFDVTRRIFEKLAGYNTKPHISSAANYVDLASGQSDLVVECTRKGNLEIAVAYGLVTEAQGIMVTRDGKNIGRKKYLEFGQNENVSIIGAASEKLADNFVKYLNT